MQFIIFLGAYLLENILGGFKHHRATDYKPALTICTIDNTGERFGLSFGSEKCPKTLGIVHNGSTEGVDVLPVLVIQKVLETIT